MTRLVHEPAPQPHTLTAASLLRDGGMQRSIEAFLLDQRSPHTRRAYGKDLKRFFGFLLARRASGEDDRIDRAAIIGYKESLLAESLEHTTVDRHLATLRSFFRWLVDDGQIPRSPAEGVRFLRPKRVSRTLGFSDEEVQSVLRMPNVHTRTGALHYAVLLVLFHCGLRRSELCELRTSHLGRERGHRVLRVRGKGDAERLITVTDPVGRAIDHYLRISRRDPRLDQPLFAPVRVSRGKTRDKGLDPSMIYYIVTRYAREAGVTSRVSPHSCRATAISNARDHGAADRAIQEFAGWTSPQMITRYDKRRTAAEDSAAKQVHYGAEDRVRPLSGWAAPPGAKDRNDG